MKLILISLIASPIVMMVIVYVFLIIQNRRANHEKQERDN